MDQTEEYRNLQNSSKFHQFLKLALQFIVSISLLSIFLTNSSMLCYYFHYLKFQFTTLIFTYTIDRKYMFLVCNGILALVVKSSGGSSTGSDKELHGFFAMGIINHEDVKPVMSEEIEESSGIRSTENFLSLNEQKEEEKLNGSLLGVPEVEEMKNGDLIIYSQENVEVELSGGWSLIPASSSLLLEEEEEVLEEEELKLSIEELNRKCDEFIRKRKEEIRIEAQRQLIKV